MIDGLNSAVFVDTWGWVALRHRRDQAHQAVEIIQQVRLAKLPIHTTDYVLDEVITLVFKREIFREALQFTEGIFRAAELGQLQIHVVYPDHFSAAWELRKQLQDKPLISFTDLTPMVVMRHHGIQYVLTQDEHFIQVGLGFIRLPYDRTVGSN